MRRDGIREPIAGDDARPVILVVDDDALIRGLLSRVLAMLGYEVVVAEGGSAAIEAVRRSEGASAVLLDVNMPDMDGVAAFSRIRALERDLPVVFCTSCGEAEVRRRIAPHDRHLGFLRKPFALEDLASIVGQAIGASGRSPTWPTWTESARAVPPGAGRADAVPVRSS